MSSRIKPHQDLGKIGDSNQIFYMCNLIARVYFEKTLLSPETSVQDIMVRFKQSIFAGLKFSFEDFLKQGKPSVNNMTPQEEQEATDMKKIA